MNKNQIYNLFPENLKKYKNISDITSIFSDQLAQVDNSIDLLKIYLDMQNLSDKVLDELAWHWNVEFYSTELQKSKKIEMIKRSYLHHIKKGTVGALESALKAIVSNLEVKEWYEYGGVPYTFRLIVAGEMLTEEEISTVYKLVSIYKNVRSELDGFIISKENKPLINFNSGIHDYKKITNKFVG
ncbi:phage tail protein, P2 protein I family [Cetobacterium ceti]|uniref:Phage tail protein, P2 protein I family n=1 Tax=Cetobacterium ceti TaxID=180163 RepID=A0A1T4QDN6_9FUSO|nr:phage tail protein I [Cetobacterium ceti]SKA01930.1 phage tail protein, P2 protein I family [Cetobacterium ceti]